MFSLMLFASRASGLCKHGLGNLSRLNVKTLERVPAPSSLAKLKDLHPWVLLHEITVYGSIWGYVEVLFIRKLMK